MSILVRVAEACNEEGLSREESGLLIIVAEVIKNCNENSAITAYNALVGYLLSKGYGIQNGMFVKM